jgi:sterol desaturase/sphingolipid hydroxylase (fatty acid hydroxylase superfamily)
MWKISRLEFLADLVLVPLYVCGAIGAASLTTSPDYWWLVWFAIGALAWTLIEYLMHRFLFHGGYAVEHLMHHRQPKSWIGVSSVLMLPLFVMVWMVCVSAEGFGNGGAIFVGYAIAYYAYVVIHLLIHHTNSTIVRRLRVTHLMHHRGSNSNFGVSTNLWDRVFRTFEAG